jgi:chemotaxis protein CheD
MLQMIVSDQIGNKKGVFLHPGEYAIADASTVVRTVLGSCVSIILWHPLRKIGAMSHFMLPTLAAGRKRTPDGRYGDEAMTLMLKELRLLGIEPTECQAKIFGGGMMFSEREGRQASAIGMQNGEMARRLLKEHRIPVVAECLYGEGHRRVVFDVQSGDVWALQVRQSLTTVNHVRCASRPVGETGLLAA